MQAYQPIENYGVIGDLNTIALVGLDGSIDFLCFPNFDSPSVFAAMLDKENGGYFKIAPKKDNLKHKQLYLPDTNVLLTRFLAQDGVGEITDFMPVEEFYVGKELIRIVSCVRGLLNFSLECRPRFDYGRSPHKVTQPSKNEILFVSQGPDKVMLRLSATVPIEIKDNDASSSFILKTGERATFILECVSDSHEVVSSVEEFANKSLFDTINYWKDWIAKSQYKGRWMEIVNRSALVLKLMTSRKYGSIVAAPTFGLPEELGGVRNWDYRYT